jgi:fluoroquinolone transport system permease protein
VTRLAAVLRADTTRITRDPFLLFMIGYPWLLVLLLREVLPWLNARLADRVTLSDYYPIAACLVALLVPNAMGIVLGFQLVEEKDEGSLVAVAVTPLSLDQYFLYRTTVYALVSLPLVVVLHELLGAVRLAPGELALVALVSLPVVPLMALVIAGYAGNQVEAFAVAKGSGFLFTGPLASFFIPRPWDAVVGILPTYWPIKAYFAAAEGSHGWLALAAIVSLLYCSLGGVLLYRRFRPRVMAG